MLDGLKYFYYEVHVATFIFISFHILAERIQHYLALKILKLIVLNVQDIDEGQVHAKDTLSYIVVHLSMKHHGTPLDNEI